MITKQSQTSVETEVLLKHYEETRSPSDLKLYKKVIAKVFIQYLGGPKKVSDILGDCTAQAVWAMQNTHIPIDHVLKLCKASHWKFTPYQIRPDYDWDSLFEYTREIIKNEKSVH